MSACLKKETLLAFADCELTSGEMGSAEQHVAACAVCRNELANVCAMNVNVNALLSSLAPDDSQNVDASAVVRIPYSGANERIRWAAVASVGVLVAALLLFVMIRRQPSAPAPDVAKIVTPASQPIVEKKEIPVATVKKPLHVGAPKRAVKVRQFQALDDGEPMQTGMIYRVSLPASSVTNTAASQSAKRIPAEVIVDEFGKVRAIRFLQ
jgi:hypothetical protein